MKPRTALFIAAALLCALSFLLDASVVAWVTGHPDHRIHLVSQWFTRWGDFPPILALLLLLLLAAWLAKRPFGIRLLLLMIGSGCAAGLAANVLRVLSGRTRPSASVPPGWYGFKDHGKWIVGAFQYSSFPSAHTAVAIGCTVPLWLLLPPAKRLYIALPATFLALCVATSRILLNAHHLSDVLSSAWLAALISTIICARFGKKSEKSVVSR